MADDSTAECFDSAASVPWNANWCMWEPTKGWREGLPAMQFQQSPLSLYYHEDNKTLEGSEQKRVTKTKNH